MHTDFALRLEVPADYSTVETLTREAFWNLHVPGCDEHYLVHILRDADVFMPALDFVACAEGKVVGNIMYARSLVALDAGGTMPVITFGPLSVLPEFQRRGVGSALVRHTLALASQLGYAAVLIYGDPLYYSRFGFVLAERYGIGTEDGYYHDALQARILQDGALDNAAGRFLEGDVYHIDAAAAASFDQAFPPKEKRTGTPSQLGFQQIIAQRKPRTQR